MDNDIQSLFNQGMMEFAAENTEKSLEILTEVLSLDPDHKVARIARGSARMRMGDAASAIADFDRALEIDPDYARALHLRGLAREHQGDDTGALEDFNRAVEIAPDYGAAVYSRASLFAKLGREDDAAADMETVTALTQANMETFANGNNVWRSHHLYAEAAMETELNR
jgi:Tfp pilus assembly protein PilF